MSRDSDNGNCQNAACKMKEQTLCNNMKDYELINTSIKENTVTIQISNILAHVIHRTMEQNSHIQVQNESSSIYGMNERRKE